jgi:hypothetical protein
MQHTYLNQTSFFATTTIMPIANRVKPRPNNVHHKKDIEKFAVCNKLISRGVANSSSANYANNPLAYLGMSSDCVNPTSFDSSDVVGVSVNGKRYGRISFDRALVLTAITARVTFVADNTAYRHNGFNIGEIELYNFLLNNGYEYTDCGHYGKFTSL